MSCHQNHAEVEGSAQRILALDIGGTFIKSAVFQNGRRERELPQVPSCSGGSRDQIFAAFRTVMRAAGAFDVIGAAIPGPFDYAAGVSRMTHKFAALEGVDLTEAFGGVPIRFVHDANAFLLGEAAAGAARGFRRAAGVTLGTGLGAACLEDGVCRCGPSGSPAEEVTLWKRPFRDGIAEDWISSRGLLARYPAESVKRLAELAGRGDRRALEAWRAFGEALSEVLTPWYFELNPGVIVIGGQIAGDFALLRTALKHLPIRPSELGNNAALLGAARLWAAKTTSNNV